MSAVLISPAISCDAALAIARADAEKMYANLERFRIEIQLDDSDWRIAFRVKEPLVTGGGPHYVIDSETGTILEKRYYQ